MEIGLDVVVFETVGEILGFFLAIEKSNDYGANIEAFGAEEFNKANDFGLVRDHVVGTDFGFLDSIAVDTENNLGIVFELLE